MKKKIDICLVVAFLTNLASANELYKPKHLYDDDYYNNTLDKNWKFYDTKYCDVKLDVDFERLNNVVSNRVYDHRTGNLKSSILYLWNSTTYDRYISSYLHEFNFRPANINVIKSKRNNYTDGVVANVEVLHYLGITKNEFKKLRWFFSAEDFAFYPEKIYRFLGVMYKVSKKFDETMWFKERHSCGIPIVCYWYDGGVIRSRWTNFYSIHQKNFRTHERRWWKIIYLKTKKD